MTPCPHLIDRIMVVMEAAFDPAFGEAWNRRQVADALTLSSTHALVVDSAAELAGLSQADIDAAGKLAADKGMPGKFAIALQNTTQQPLLSVLTNRATRKALFEASWGRTERGGANDLREVSVGRDRFHERSIRFTGSFFSHDFVWVLRGDFL